MNVIKLLLTVAGQADPEADNSDNEGDQVWQGIPPPDEAGPPGIVPAANGSSAAIAISLAAGIESSAPSPLPAAKTTPASGGGTESRPEEFAASSSAAHARATQQDPQHGSQSLPAQDLKGDLHVAPVRLTCRAKSLVACPAMTCSHMSWYWHDFPNSAGASAFLCAGAAPRARKRLRLPTLAEEPLKERAAQQDVTNNQALAGVPTSKSAAEEAAQADTHLHPIQANGPTRHGEEEVQCHSMIPSLIQTTYTRVTACIRSCRSYHLLMHLTASFLLQHEPPSAPAEPSDGPVAAALRQALTIAEDEASDDSGSVQEVSGQQGSPGRLARDTAYSKQSAAVQHSAAPVTGVPSKARPDGGTGKAGMAVASKRLQKDSTAAAMPASESSKAAPDQSTQSVPEASGVKGEQEEKPSGSIAFTGPVQDVTGSMPGIPGSLTAGRPDAPKAQPVVGRPRPARSDADLAAERAAEAEEELHADLHQEQQQEPPEDDGPCADPWAEDPW